MIVGARWLAVSPPRAFIMQNGRPSTRKRTGFARGRRGNCNSGPHSSATQLFVHQCVATRIRTSCPTSVAPVFPKRPGGSAQAAGFPVWYEQSVP